MGDYAPPSDRHIDGRPASICLTRKSARPRGAYRRRRFLRRRRGQGISGRLRFLKIVSMSALIHRRSRAARRRSLTRPGHLGLLAQHRVLWRQADLRPCFHQHYSQRRRDPNDIARIHFELKDGCSTSTRLAAALASTVRPGVCRLRSRLRQPKSITFLRPGDARLGRRPSISSKA